MAEPFTKAQHQQMLSLARDSIEFGVIHNKTIDINVDEYDSRLQQQGCSFVTLRKDGALGCCIGSLSPYQPLIKDIAVHGYGAAFNDHRFPNVKQQEIPQIKIHISVLTPQVKIDIESESDLLDQLIPFEDGLTIEDGIYRATFLPAVWQQMPDKYEFLEQLKRKAGMQSDYWSDTLSCYRYHTISIEE